MYEKLIKAVKNLGSPEVLIVGDFMLDVYVYGDALRISPEAPVPVLKVTETHSCCGGAGSVAADLAALGAKPVCIGIIGEDANATELTVRLAELGADVTGLLKTADRPTVSKQRLIGLAQHRHRQQLMRIDQESAKPLTDAQKEAILATYETHLLDSDIVCLQDYNKGVLSDSVCREMIQMATDAGKSVLVDPGPTADYSKYKGATLITPNRKETALAVGWDIESEQTAAEAAEKLVNTLDLEAAVITLDKQGAYLKTAGFSGLIPTRVRNVYDVTGAGDVVLATLAVTLAGDCDYETAVHLANLAGGIEVGKFGAAVVKPEELISEVIGRNLDRSGKIRTIEILREELQWHRLQGKRIAFTNGCFDVLHRGHTEYLQFCKKHGDVLVVGLNSDDSVKAIKGPDRPVNNEKDRSAVLAALEAVDYIAMFSDETPLELIKQIKPDVLVKGEDWAEKGVVGREFVESYGGKVELAPLVKGKSSTSTIAKMKGLETESE